MEIVLILAVGLAILLWVFSVACAFFNALMIFDLARHQRLNHSAFFAFYFGLGVLLFSGSFWTFLGRNFGGVSIFPIYWPGQLLVIALPPACAIWHFFLLLKEDFREFHDKWR